MSSGSKPLVQGCGEALGVDGCNDTNSDTPGTENTWLNTIKHFSLQSINFTCHKPYSVLATIQETSYQASLSSTSYRPRQSLHSLK